MFMKKSVIAFLLLVALLVAGCEVSEEGQMNQLPDEPSESDVISESEEVSVPSDQLPGTECSSAQDCVIAGCSGQLCLPAADSDVVTHCADLPEYACLRLTSCGCINGICAWNPNEEYKSCMEDVKNSDQSYRELR